MPSTIWASMPVSNTLRKALTAGGYRCVPDSLCRISSARSRGTADSTGVFGATEQNPVPEGAANYNSPHVVCDTDGDPHVVFERDWYPSRSKCWYSNRKGGSWKPPVLAFNGLVVM